MGYGSWSRDSFVSYSTSKGFSTSLATGRATIDNLQDNFKSRDLVKELNPLNITRECRDSEEHPETVPVILALDVTGSMGSAATETASALSVIMEDLLTKVKDIEFCIMGIGDLAYDDAPIQMSQFESDIRIAEHLDKVYFEFGGGVNQYESYTAAWYMGARHTDLDCWKRGKKGIIITMGDENINPYLPKDRLSRVTGDSLQDDVETKALYAEVQEKYDVYHIYVNHGISRFEASSKLTFTEVIPEQNYFQCNVNELADTIVNIITGAVTRKQCIVTDNGEGIAW